MKIEPDKQFPHSLKVVTALGALYGLQVTDYQEASSGIENTTLIVETAQQTYVFRVYRHGKKSHEHIKAELDFVSYLAANAIPVAPVIPNKQGQLLTTLEVTDLPWQIIAMLFVVGEHQDNPSAELLTSMAETQARMHLLASNYTAPTDNIRRLPELVEDEFIKQIDMGAVDTELKALLQRGLAYKVVLGDTLPKGPCHLDYDSGNILSRGDTITAVLDFDDLAIAPYVVCLAYSLWHVLDRYGKATCEAYLATYEQLRPLSDQERQMLSPIMLFRHYVITPIKVLHGETSPSDIQDYLHIEQQLLV